MDTIQAVRWSPDGIAVRIIDQRRLPAECIERDLRSLDDVCDAIRTLAVRGAPAIGICGAMGLVAAAAAHLGESALVFGQRLRVAAAEIRGARPTAVNLSWAVDRLMRRVAHRELANAAVIEEMRSEATAILDEDRLMCEAIGAHGAPLLRNGARVLTHCNAGALATGGIGTALAPVYHAARAGRLVTVVADETRPLMQGSRLTAWELSRAGIDVTVIADNMAASLMRNGEVDLCLVGADRIAANGDVANKIGTYGLAVLAQHHGIPFFVAAPSSTIDPSTPSGDSIVIEERGRAEVAGIGDEVVVPDAARVRNPAFDVTPAALVTAIVTEAGVFRGPYRWRAKEGGAEWGGEGGGAVGEVVREAPLA